MVHKPLTNRQASQIAKRLSATLIASFEAGRLSLLNDDEIVQVEEELLKIADRICPDRYNTAEEIVASVTDRATRDIGRNAA